MLDIVGDGTFGYGDTYPREERHSNPADGADYHNEPSTLLTWLLPRKRRTSIVTSVPLSENRAKKPPSGRRTLILSTISSPRSNHDSSDVTDRFHGEVGWNRFDESLAT